jgi:signal peptidase I
MTFRLFVVVVAVLTLAGCGGDKSYRILGSAMEPTLHCAKPARGCEADEQDRVLAEEVEADELRRGDIVVFETPPAAEFRCGAGGTFMKRLIGLPGERIAKNRRDSRSPETFKVPKGQYYLLGDNRSQSCDSREWGSVPAANIHHRAVAVERSSGRVEFR